MVYLENPREKNLKSEALLYYIALIIFIHFIFKEPHALKSSKAGIEVLIETQLEINIIRPLRKLGIILLLFFFFFFLGSNPGIGKFPG